MAQRRAPLVTISEHVGDDGVLVRLSGRLDRRSAADVRLVLHRLVDDGGVPVLLDLEQAVIGDSTALGLLVELRRLAARRGGELRVVAADDRTSRLLHRARMRTLLAAPLRAAPAIRGTLAGAV